MRGHQQQSLSGGADVRVDNDHVNAPGREKAMGGAQNEGGLAHVLRLDLMGQVYDCGPGLMLRTTPSLLRRTGQTTQSPWSKLSAGSADPPYTHDGNNQEHRSQPTVNWNRVFPPRAGCGPKIGPIRKDLPRPSIT